MNTIIKLITLFICGILFSNCIHNNNMRYDPSQFQFLKQMKLMYEKNIVDFFPSDYNNPSNESKWGSYHYSPQDNSGGSCFRGLAYFSKEVSSSLLDSLELVNYIEKIKYSDTLFSIDIPYMKDAESYRNIMRDSYQIPIASMRHSYFTLGDYYDTLFIGENRFTRECEILPDDLIVYIVEAANGNFWKNKEKANCEERPVLSEYWKHGYVKGIAISRELSRVCWWAMAW